MNNIQVIYNGEGNVLLVLGDNGIALSRSEAEQLFVDLGHTLQDMDNINNED